MGGELNSLQGVEETKRNTGTGAAGTAGLLRGA